MSEKEESSTDYSAAGPSSSKRGILAGMVAVGLAGLSGAVFLTGEDQASQDAARPTLLPATEKQMPRPPIPKTASGEIDFIVRFDDVPEIEECLSTFRKDPEHARAVFQDWATGYPALSGFRLKKANYSGELVLTWSGDGERPSRDTVMGIREQLQAMTNVKYADPDFSTQIEDAPG